MNKEIVKQKEGLVEEIYENIKGASASILVEYRGLSVAKLSELRKQLRKEEATLTVLKNTLISRAANKAGYADLDKQLEGPNALVVTKKDACATAKVLTKFAKRNDELVVKAKPSTVKGVYMKNLTITTTMGPSIKVDVNA